MKLINDVVKKRTIIKKVIENIQDNCIKKNNKKQDLVVAVRSRN